MSLFATILIGVGLWLVGLALFYLFMERRAKVLAYRRRVRSLVRTYPERPEIARNRLGDN
jgi:hypothetical protein